MFPKSTKKAPTRRVSFSERVFYSDDPSTSTVSTDDDYDVDLFDEETIESFDEESINSFLDEKAAKPEAVVSNRSTEEEVIEQLGDYFPNNCGEGMIPNDEPPITFRDSLNYTRPTDFLGGSGTEAFGCPPHRVKLRKSWLLEQGEEHQDHIEFEQWKRERGLTANYTSAQRVGKVFGTVTKNSSAISRSLPTCTDNNEADGERNDAQKMIQSNDIDKAEHESVLDEKLDDTVVVKTTKVIAVKKPLKSTFGVRNPQPFIRRENRLQRSDEENEEYSKEITDLKEEVAKLQRQFDTIEVRHISQLADVEEETTKRMREFRERANGVERKMRAREEKKSLKEKAMSSHDLIEQLRKSNQKLRADSIKFRKEVENLKENNQLLEERNSFHVHYANQFQNFERREVALAEEINDVLNRNVPKYKKLIVEMEEGIATREDYGQIESRIKDLYLNCIQAIFGTLEENCEDLDVVETVAIRLEEADDSEKMHASDLCVSLSKEAVTTTRSDRRSRGKLVQEIDRPIPSKSIRRSKSVDSKTQRNLRGKPRQLQTQPNVSPSKWPSFRSTRLPTSRKVVSNDDSSTCSTNSAVSDSFSLDFY